MDLSDTGIALIADHEGCVLHTYVDGGGRPTIGIGHLILPGEDFSAGLTKEQAYDLFRVDAAAKVAAVNQLVKVPLTQNQFDALVSFTFNLGEGALANSTLLRCLNACRYDAAADQFGFWVYDKGVKELGLVVRREDEKELFLTA